MVMTSAQRRAEADALLVEAICESARNNDARAAVLVAAAQVQALLAFTADQDW